MRAMYQKLLQDPIFWRATLGVRVLSQRYESYTRNPREPQGSDGHTRDLMGTKGLQDPHHFPPNPIPAQSPIYAPMDKLKYANKPAILHIFILGSFQDDVLPHLAWFGSRCLSLLPVYLLPSQLFYAFQMIFTDSVK